MKCCSKPLYCRNNESPKLSHLVCFFLCLHFYHPFSTLLHSLLCPQIAPDNPNYNNPSSPPAPSEDELETSTPVNPAKGSDKNPQIAPDNPAYNTPKKPKPVSKAASSGDDDTEGDDDDDDGKCTKCGNLKCNCKCSGKKSVDWNPGMIYDFIKQKSLNLDYNPHSDCFTFKHSCDIINSIALDQDSPPEDLEFTGMKSFGQPRKSMEPTVAELERINMVAGGASIGKDDVKILTIRAADTNLDRSNEKFSKKALEDMAALSINKPVMNDHRIHDVKETFGTIFDAKVVHTKDGPVLFQKAYVPNLPEFQHTIKCIGMNVGAKASVHFKTPRDQYLCNTCNKAMFSEKGFCGHYVGYSRNADGSLCSATNNRVVDYLESTRTAAPDSPAADMKMAAGGDFSSKSFNPGVSSPTVVQSGLISIAKSLGEGLLGDSSKLNQANPGNGAKTMPDESKGKELGEFVEAVKTLHGSVGGFSTLIDSQKSVIEGQKKLIDSMITSIQTEKTAREMEVKEVRDRFDVLFAYQQKQAEMLDTISAKLDTAASKSIDDLVHKIAAIAPNAEVGNTSVEEKEKSLQVNQYMDILGHWVSKHAK